MTIAVADSFYAAYQKLGTNDQARAGEFIMKFAASPSSPGLNLERVQHAIDKGMRSARVSRDVRAIVHVSDGRYVALHVGEHDEAYKWAEKRRVENHPVTGVLQVVPVAEAVLTQTEPKAQAQTAFFAVEDHDDEYLVSLGVPADWLPTVRKISSDDELIEVCSLIGEDVAERLIDLASGKFVTPPKPVPASAGLSASPDNLRRFWVLEGEDELREWLDKPFEKWLHYLHPTQRALATRTFKGPIKVTGSAGTGKTVVALHRARNLAREGKRVLITSFVKTLCDNIERGLDLLCLKEERGKIEVRNVHKLAFDLCGKHGLRLRALDDDKIAGIISKHAMILAPLQDPGFLNDEWERVIDLQGITSWDGYRDADRRGRGKALNVRQRKEIWKVLEAVLAELTTGNRTTFSGMCRAAEQGVKDGTIPRPYDAVIIDEVQDLKPSEIKFLATLAGPAAAEGGLMLVGDTGQRIYPGGFSLRSLGIDVRGRSRVLRINYRTTEQIRKAADSLLAATSDDMDGETERRDLTRSLLNGPYPKLHQVDTLDDEKRMVTDTVAGLIKEGIDPHDIALFARTRRLVGGFRKALTEAGHKVQFLTKKTDTVSQDGIVLGTMHRAKGLEFQAVFVAGCSDDELPNQAALNSATEESDKAEVLELERNLIYVSMTRARDEVHVSWHGKPSRFLKPMTEFLARKENTT